jgi:hypothetical protein
MLFYSSTPANLRILGIPYEHYDDSFVIFSLATVHSAQLAEGSMFLALLSASKGGLL